MRQEAVGGDAKMYSKTSLASQRHMDMYTQTLILKYLVKNSLLVLDSKKFICKNFFFSKAVTITIILILPSEIQNQSNPWQAKIWLA